MVVGSTTELQLSSTMLRVKPTVAGGGEGTTSLWILWWEMGFSACLGVSQLSGVVCEMVGWPSPGVVCSQELQISSECMWLPSQGQVGKSWAKPFPSKRWLSVVGGGGVGFSHILTSRISDAGGKTTSEILQ